MPLRIPRHIRTALFLFASVLLVFAPIIYLYTFVITTTELNDFYPHMLWARDLAQNGLAGISPALLAHAGWQILLVFLNKLFDVSFEAAGFLAALLSFETSALVLSFWYRPAFPDIEEKGWPGWLVVLGVCIAAPVSLLWPVDHLLYLGYIGITSYHNPTIILLKPFAILQFIFAFQCFRETGLVKNWQIAVAAVISVLCTFIKPNLAICLLPALAVLSAYRILKREYLNYKALLWGLGLPTVVVLVWQFVLTYQTNETSVIVFLPFVVMGWYSKYLGWKFLLSILFPLAALVVYFKQAIKDIRVILAWLAFLFGVVFTYFLAESGSRLLDGNFGWSGEITSVLLFAVSTLFYFERSVPTARFAKTLALLWSLHVIFGIFYYLHIIFSGTYH